MSHPFVADIDKQIELEAEFRETRLKEIELSERRSEGLTALRALYASKDAISNPVSIPKPLMAPPRQPPASILDNPLKGSRGLPTEGRAREVFELLNANLPGLTRANLRKITGRDSQEINTPLDRGVRKGDFKKDGETYSITAQGIAHLKRSAPYTGSLSIVTINDAASSETVTATSPGSESVAAAVFQLA